MSISNASTITDINALHEIAKENTVKMEECQKRTEAYSSRSRFLNTTLLVSAGLVLIAVAGTQCLGSLGVLGITKEVVEMVSGIAIAIFGCIGVLWSIITHKKESLEAEANKYSKVADEAQKRISEITKIATNAA